MEAIIGIKYTFLDVRIHLAGIKIESIDPQKIVAAYGRFILIKPETVKLQDTSHSQLARFV